MTAMTMTVASASVINTSRMAPLMKVASSEVTTMRDALGEGLVELGDRRPHALRDGERVGLRLADDAEADAGLAVEAQARLQLGRAVDDVGDVADARPLVDVDVLDLIAAWWRWRRRARAARSARRRCCPPARRGRPTSRAASRSLMARLRAAIFAGSIMIRTIGRRSP